jgi:hypothetical protein
MRGASAEDWLPLFQPQLMECKVYEFDYNDKACYHPVCGDVPWPIIFLASKYARKYILTRRQLPDPVDVSTFATQFGRLTERQWAREAGQRPSVCLKGSKWRSNVSECNSIIPPEVRAWVRLARARIAGAAKRAVDARGHGMAWCNTPPIIGFAMRLLRKSEWALMMTDKDGGWCIVKRELRKQIHVDVLGSDLYRCCVVNDSMLGSYANWYRTIVRQIAKLEDEPALMGELCRSIMKGHAIAVLQTTIKSHKDDGQVSYRGIHGSARYAYSGIATWLTVQLRAMMANFTHLVKDSKTLVKYFKSETLPLDGCHMVTIDVKDYYLSGDLEVLENHAVMGVDEGGRKEMIRRVVHFLLNTQMVKSHEIGDDDIWEVTRGTGIGLPHSGDLCDWIFYQMIEKHVLPTLDAFGIRRLWRYKDDILVVASCRVGTRNFVEKLRTLGKGTFKFEVSDVKSAGKSIRFLDLSVRISEGRMVSVPGYKPTGLGLYLGRGSAHPFHVHKAWPKMMLCRVRDLCSRFEDIDEARAALVNRLELGGIANAQKVLDNLKVRWALADAGTRTSLALANPEDKVYDRWCILPFHPIWERQLRKAVASINKDDAMRNMLESASRDPQYRERRDKFRLSRVKISIAWKNTLAPNGTLLQQ